MPKPRAGGAYRSVVAFVVPISIVVLLLAGGASAAGSFSHFSSPAGSGGGYASAASSTPRATTSPAPLVGSGGAVSRTVFVNYNASWLGNFVSSVDDWSVGPGTYVPSTGELWLSDLPVSANGGPLPKLAPAILYSPLNNSFVGIVPALANTSDLLYDGANGLLYATEPLTNSVGVFNPITETWVDRAIPVGTDPTAMVIDNATGDLIVANTGSANLSLLNLTTDSVNSTSISTDLGPAGLVLNQAAGVFFVECENSSFYQVFNATTFAVVLSEAVPGHPGGIAYSETTNTVAISVPSRGSVVIVNATTGIPSFITIVGPGVQAIATTANFTDFVAAISSGTTLVEVNASSGAIINGAITVQENPASIYLVPGSSLFFVWCSWSRDLVSVGLSSTSISTAPSPNLGATPVGVAYDSVSSLVVVADPHDDSLQVISPISLRTVAWSYHQTTGPVALASDPSSGLVDVGLPGGLFSFNPLTTQAVVENYSIPGTPEALIVDTTDNVLWELNNVSGLIAFSLPNLTEILAPGLGAGEAGVHTLAWDSKSDRLFSVVNTTGTTAVAVLNASNGSVVNSSVVAAPGITSLAYDPVDGDVYALGVNVTIIDATSLKVAGPDLVIAPHAEAGAIIYDPSRQDLYATTMDSVTSGTVSVFGGGSTDAAYAGVSAMALGEDPVALAPIALPGGTGGGTSEIWVANEESGTLSLIADSPPKIDGFAAVPSILDIGQTTTLVVTFTGGAGASVVSYAGLPVGCTSANLTELTCTPSTVGDSTVTVTVTDVLGDSDSVSTNLSVNLGLIIQTLIAPGDFPFIELGWTIGIFPTVFGGVAPYQYAWSFGDGTSSASQNITHTYASTGVYLMQLNVTDSVGGRGTVAWVIDVYAPPQLQLTASTLATDIGETVSFSTVTTGGYGNGSTFWSFGDGDFGTGSAANHSWKTAGLYVVSATYEDQYADEATASVSIQVNGTPAGLFVVSGGTNANPARPGTPFYYNATMNGGTTPFAIVWHFGDGSEGSGAQVIHNYSAPGNYTITVNATDAAGGTVNASLIVTVLPALSPTSSSGSSSNFPLGVFLGIVIGVAVAAVLIFAVSGRKRKTTRPPPPPSPYVPPNRADWKED